MRRFTIPALVGIVILSACSSSAGTGDSTTSVGKVEPRADATYRGDLVGAAGVSGWVSFKTSASGDVIDPLVWLDMTAYDCGGGVRMTSGQGVSPIGVTIAVIDGRFVYDSTVTWRGAFTSDSSATGTVQGNLVQPDCPFGPFEWTAGLTSVAEPTTTTVQAAGNTSTTAGGAGEYAALCTINQQMVDRAAEITPDIEDVDFWESQRDDNALMVDLVPDTLRADMALTAEAWRRFVDLLSEYGYNSQTMLTALGNEGYTNIFTPEVTAASARVQEFITVTCGR